MAITLKLSRENDFHYGLLGGNRHAPQSWNRYTYVMGNPLKLVDPSGMAPINSCSGSACNGSVDVGVSFGNDTDLGSFYDFIIASYSFFGGAANAFSTNFLLGAGRYNSTAPGYQLGQAVGDLASIPAGLEEALYGGDAELLGAVFDSTGPGALVGVPLNAVGLVMIGQGGTASALGTINFMEGMKGGGKTSGKVSKDSLKTGQEKVAKLQGAARNALKAQQGSSRQTRN